MIIKPMQSKVWIESLIAHLELAKQVASRLPAGERLEAEDLNKVLELLQTVKETYLLMCELQGFKTKPKK